MGDYSVSREQFDPDNFVSRKIFQHGTRIVDSDMNEQVLIDLHRQRRISYGLMGRIDQRIGVGFAFKSGGVNEVSLNKGDAFVEMTDDGIGGTHHIYKEDDTIITGFTTPSSGDRTDYVYLDIYFEIIDSEDDTGLINPDVAAESAVDIRAKMDWLKIEGASIPSAPAGHTYVGLLQIDRLDGNANITEPMCTNLLAQFDDWLQFDGAVALQGNMAVDAGITIDGVDISDLESQYQTFRDDYRQTIFLSGHTRDHADTTDPPTADYEFTVTNDGSYHILVNRTVYKAPSMNKIRAKIRYVWGSLALTFKLEHVGGNYDEETYESAGGYLDFVIDVSGVSDGTEMTINFEMKCLSATGSKGYDLNIWGAYS